MNGQRQHERADANLELMAELERNGLNLRDGDYELDNDSDSHTAMGVGLLAFVGIATSLVIKAFLG